MCSRSTRTTTRVRQRPRPCPTFFVSFALLLVIFDVCGEGSDIYVCNGGNDTILKPYFPLSLSAALFRRALSYQSLAQIRIGEGKGSGGKGHGAGLFMSPDDWDKRQKRLLVLAFQVRWNCTGIHKPPPRSHMHPGGKIRGRGKHART